MTNSIIAIEEFLAGWKTQARKYYTEQKAEYARRSELTFEITEENVADILKYGFLADRKYSAEKVTEIMTNFENGTMNENTKDNLKVSISDSQFNIWKQSKTKSEIAIIEVYSKRFAAELEITLEKEVNAKRKILIARIEKVAGKIVNANNLFIGVNGEINGQVIGEDKTVNVTAIYAGGYNVQCLHYRVLVKAVK